MKGFAFDYLVVIGYLCAIAAFGSSFYRRKSTAEEYFLGGRSMWCLPAGIFIIAADLSAFTVMGISGLIIASIFAASMSVMSAGINSLTTATTVDFYQRVFHPGRGPEHYALVGRIGTVVWGAVVTLLALVAGRLGELALSHNKASSVVSGPLLGIFLLGILTRGATAQGSLLGCSGGHHRCWVGQRGNPMELPPIRSHRRPHDGNGRLPGESADKPPKAEKIYSSARRK